MNALRFSFKYRTLDLKRIEKPAITEPDDILIKVAYAGICGTDLHVLDGEYPCRQAVDITLGHEISGTVVKTGRDVVHFGEGDRVAVYPNRGCKRCGFCHAGKPHFCKIGCSTNTIGIYRDGGWAEYVLCPEELVYKIPDSVTLEQAVLAEPVCSIIHGWELLFPTYVGEKILIVGAGVAGSLWAAALHLQGHRNVTISEPNIARLDMIRRLKTGYTLTTPDQLKKNANIEPEKYLFDVIIDCSGDGPAIEHAFTLLNFGGRFCQYGVARAETKIEINPFNFFWKELKFFGVKINPNSFIKALGLIQSMGRRYLDFHSLGIKTFALDEYKEAIDTLNKGTILKAVFKM